MNAVVSRGAVVQELPEPIARSGYERHQPQDGKRALYFHKRTIAELWNYDNRRRHHKRRAGTVSTTPAPSSGLRTGRPPRFSVCVSIVVIFTRGWPSTNN